MKNLLLVDDHKIVRSGLKTLLSDLNFDQIDEADSGRVAYSLAQENSYSLIIMDISMEGMSGLDALSKIINRLPKQKILILSMHDSDLVIEKAKKLGAMGFVTKSDISDNLFQAVEHILNGGNFFPETKASYNQLNQLNEREFEIFKMIASGKSIKNIAADMNISQKTVANYQTSIKQKLEIDNPIDFYKLAVELNLIKS
ncbi:two component transcriptional regulator, LuxR family [beta proteobacterium KB13]|uniref:Two component transcriptional regulator, LuxR family n=1 Tax=beta proteobacterium KB13 TaxID=314607 RepID=B6BTE7_9PROT|nr:two component transcriptional regulator, LuxR family [beta proteobacterium KB13]